MIDKPINLFYEEPDPDRWLRFDRYPRRLIRRLVRGKSKPGGVMMIALGLMRGLSMLRVPYRFNDYAHIKKHPEELACIIGKPQLLFDRQWKNPILFGAGVFSHPVDCPDLFERYPNVKRMLVPGEWMKRMCEPYYGDRVLAWPAGIDADKWAPAHLEKKYDFLIYNKIRWKQAAMDQEIIQPITRILSNHQLSYHFIEYGCYRPDELKEKVAVSRAVIFLCEHETQGLAYQQILSTNTPVLAWDRGGFWQDPAYYPMIKYGPVSSVPYWDSTCGETFCSSADFEQVLIIFMTRLMAAFYAPRNFILENLTLEKSARQYLEIIGALNEDSSNR